MSWDDFRSTPASTKVKEPLVRSTNIPHYYAIFRISTKYKTINSIGGFIKHCERENEVANADKNIENEILIGNSNVMNNIKSYVSDIKIRKNAVVARSLLMTASPDFFKAMSADEKQLWIADNIKFLNNYFGSNCVYATLHKDEKTWHIHAVIVPKFINKKGEPILSNTRYFDGIQKMREWQDNYSNSMKQRFKCLNRGVRYSKQKHIELKHFYGLLSQNVNEKDIKQLTAKAKNSELLEIKIKAIQKTLEVYKNYNSKNDLEKQSAILESKKLINEIEKIKDDKESYKQALSLISQSYKVPQYVIDQAIDMCKDINEKEK